MANIEVIAKHPLAVDSPDHLMPHGTRQPSQTSVIFKRKLELLYPNKSIRILDLGCAGGEFVKDMIDHAHIAVGLEGSDWSKNTQRAAWPIVSKFLFTCDITKPFEVKEDGRPMKFDFITAWDVMEHIKTTDLAQVLGNVRSHLSEGGLFIASINFKPSVINGVELHRTVRPRSWSVEAYSRHAFRILDDYLGFFKKRFINWSPYSFNLVACAGHFAPRIPKESLRKRIFELWAGSKMQKTLNRIVSGY